QPQVGPARVGLTPQHLVEQLRVLERHGVQARPTPGLLPRARAQPRQQPTVARQVRQPRRHPVRLAHPHDHPAAAVLHPLAHPATPVTAATTPAPIASSMEMLVPSNSLTSTDTSIVGRNDSTHDAARPPCTITFPCESDRSASDPRHPARLGPSPTMCSSYA